MLPCAPSASIFLPFFSISSSQYSAFTILNERIISTASKNAGSHCCQSIAAVSYCFSICRCLRVSLSYFSRKLGERISPTRKPFLPVLSMYAGPIPFSVEPIFSAPFAASDAASSARCVGRMRWAFCDKKSLCVKSGHKGAIFSISFCSVTGSITTPLPIRFRQWV